MYPLIAKAGSTYTTKEGKRHRLTKDTKVHWHANEYAKVGHVVVHHAETGEYMHIRKDSLKDLKEDTNPAAPTTAPNTSLGIKAGPIFIGKRNKDKNGKTGQGSQRQPMDTQIIMAGDNTDGELVETLSKGATAGDWIHDFVHSKNGKFKGDSKKQRIKRALGAYYAKQRNEMVEGVTGATRMDIQKTYDHTFIHAPGWTVAQRTAHVEKHHQVKNVQVNSYGDVVNYKHLHEETLDEARMPLKGHPYHAKSDAELHYIIKDAGEASRHHDEMHKGTGAYNKYADQVNDAATILHHRKTSKSRPKVKPFRDAAVTGNRRDFNNEDVITSMEDLAPILESYADWHDQMEKKGREGSEVAFKIKNAGGRTEAHLGSKKIGHYDHTTRKGHMSEEKEEHAIAQAGWGYDTHDGNFRRLKSDTKVRLAPKEHAKPHHVIAYHTETGERMHIQKRALKKLDESITEASPHKTFPNAHFVHGRNTEGKRVYYTGKAGSDFISHKGEHAFRYDSHHQAHERAKFLNGMTAVHGVHFTVLSPELKEDVIYEAGRASKNKMKRKYLGKTRGTTATGKAAHEVVIDPIIKTDDTKRRGM